jgi:hypothetical protein
MINNAIFCRHFTTTRPLPPRTDIASSQTCPFDSVNSPRSILLAPMHWMNRKRTKSRKIKKRRRRKRKTRSGIIHLMYRTIMY